MPPRPRTPRTPRRSATPSDRSDAKAFADQYGTNHNKKNAFGKCVSQKAHEADGEGDGGS